MHHKWHSAVLAFCSMMLYWVSNKKLYYLFSIMVLEATSTFCILMPSLKFMKGSQAAPLSLFFWLNKLSAAHNGAQTLTPMLYINFELPFIGSSRRLHLLLKLFIIAMARYFECFPYIELASEIDDDDDDCLYGFCDPQISLYWWWWWWWWRDDDGDIGRWWCWWWDDDDDDNDDDEDDNGDDDGNKGGDDGDVGRWWWWWWDDRLVDFRGLHISILFLHLLRVTHRQENVQSWQSSLLFSFFLPPA